MKKVIFYLLILILFLFNLLGYSYEFLPDLITNYSNFSYIHSVAVGFKYVYFGTTNGVTRYNISEKQWDSPLTGIEGLDNSEIFSLKVSFDDEYIWVRTASGYYEYNSVFNRWTPIEQIPDETTNGKHIGIDFDYIPPANYHYFNTGILADRYNNAYAIRDIVDDGWGNEWIGTWGLGAFHAENSSRILNPLTFGLLQQDVTKIYSDQGTLWMGGTDTAYTQLGFTTFNWAENRFEHILTEPGLLSLTGQVNAITAGEEQVFVGTEDGLFIIDKEQNQIIDHLYQNSGLPDNQILSLLVSENMLYIGTEYGLGIININSGFSKTSFKTILPNHAILSLDHIDNHIWIGTHLGTFRLNLSNEKLGYLKSPEISGKREVPFIKHTDQKIWLVVDYELKSIDRESAEVENYPEILQYNDLRSIAVMDTIVAVATYYGLLLIFDGENDSHFIFTTSDGLLSNDIRDLVFDGEYIWLGTDKGLTRFWYKHPSLF
ncbi:MAG: hypothetical protein GY865_20420 [candidate division Zixibacteria bacterium]|nr:hypothetical protein [candidate division Zixibacteria bacterium]